MSHRAKQLLEQARTADALDANARERMLDGLAGKLARGELPLPEIDAGPLLVSKASWLVKLTSSFAGKVGLSVLGALLIAAGAVLWRPEGAPPAITTAPPRPTAAPAPQAPPASTPAAIESEPTAEPVKRRRRAPSSRVEAAPQPEASERTLVIEPELETTDEPAMDAPITPQPEAEPEARAPKRPPTPATTLDDELALLRRAYSELNAGRAERAFDVLDVHAERFPRGELEEAREVARMLALCAMDKAPAAKARARQFLATHPDSPFAGRVRGICPATKTP